MRREYTQYIENAERDFGKNIATYQKGEAVDILDFKRSGSICYYLRAVFDHQNPFTNAIYISGDVGEAVIYPTCHSDLEHVVECFTRRDNGKIDVNYDYFIEKIKTASDRYRWSTESFSEDLREEVMRLYGEGNAMSEKIDTFIEDKVESFWPQVIIDPERGPVMNDEATSELQEILPDFDAYECGRRVSVRIFMWLVALRMAWEQLEQKNKEKDNDKGK